MEAYCVHAFQTLGLIAAIASVETMKLYKSHRRKHTAKEAHTL